jgi:hypothetical protein
MRKKFNLRNVVAIATCLAAMAACEKKDEPIVQHDTVYKFTNMDVSAFYPAETSPAKASADSAEVRKVVLRATGSFNNFNANVIAIWIEGALKPIFALSPKITGDGTFDFKSVAYADSIWLVQNGFKVVTR